MNIPDIDHWTPHVTHKCMLTCRHTYTHTSHTHTMYNPKFILFSTAATDNSMTRRSIDTNFATSLHPRFFSGWD